MISAITSCPCGSTSEFEQCCYPLLKGERHAANAEALMRSRYTAYVTQHFDYILATYGPEQRKNLSLNELKQSAAGSTWLKLEVHNFVHTDLHAKVEFNAYYMAEKQFYVLHETSDFICENDRWYYTTGVIHSDSGPYAQQRNDLCLCQSGKKYKKCCAIR